MQEDYPLEKLKEDIKKRYRMPAGLIFLQIFTGLLFLILGTYILLTRGDKVAMLPAFLGLAIFINGLRSWKPRINPLFLKIPISLTLFYAAYLTAIDAVPISMKVNGNQVELDNKNFAKLILILAFVLAGLLPWIIDFVKNRTKK